MSGMTEQDARALTYLATRLRTETHGAGKWDDAGTFAAIAKLIGHNLGVSIEQVVRHACDPNAKTPGAIHRPFTPEPEPRRGDLPPRRSDECRQHPGEYADACRVCAAERVGGEAYGHDDYEDFLPPTGRWDAQTCREAVRASKGT